MILALRLQGEDALPILGLGLAVVLLGLGAYHPAGSDVVGQVGMVALPLAMAAVGLRWTRGERGWLPRLAQLTVLATTALALAGVATTLSPVAPLAEVSLGEEARPVELPPDATVDLLLRTRWPADEVARLTLTRGSATQTLEGPVTGLPSDGTPSNDPAYAQWTDVRLPGASATTVTLQDAYGFERGAELIVAPAPAGRAWWLLPTAILGMLALVVQGWASRRSKRSWLVVAVGILLGLADGALFTVGGSERSDAWIGLITRAVLIGGSLGVALTYLLARWFEPPVEARPPVVRPRDV